MAYDLGTTVFHFHFKKQPIHSGRTGTASTSAWSRSPYRSCSCTSGSSSAPTSGTPDTASKSVRSTRPVSRPTTTPTRSPGFEPGLESTSTSLRPATGDTSTPWTPPTAWARFRRSCPTRNRYRIQNRIPIQSRITWAVAAMRRWQARKDTEAGRRFESRPTKSLKRTEKATVRVDQTVFKLSWHCDQK